jgi:hypothetical protein
MAVRGETLSITTTGTILSDRDFMAYQVAALAMVEDSGNPHLVHVSRHPESEANASRRLQRDSVQCVVTGDWVDLSEDTRTIFWNSFRTERDFAAAAIAEILGPIWKPS